MKNDKKKCGTPVSGANDTPGEQAGSYENATPQNVKQETKNLNNIGAPGKEY